MKKLLGIFAFLCLLYLLILMFTDTDAWGSNNFNLTKRIGVYGISCLGVGLLIITGGVDLSIGSVICFCATLFCWLVVRCNIAIPLAIIIVLMSGAAIGALNGIFITYFKLQAFVVTLCGLFAYRGIARWINNDEPSPIGNTFASYYNFFNGSFLSVSVFLWLLACLFVVATILLHFTVYGRYFFAIGSNEKAAQYSGIHVDLYKILAYSWCSIFAAIASLIEVFHSNSVQPSSTGSFMELYAIAGAVLGGCSLRGGEGTTIGMVIGTAILCLLRNLIQMSGINDQLESVVVGLSLLICAIIDEALRRGLTWRDVLAALYVIPRWRIRG